ncbi:polyprenyl synthetase family protein [Streptomyces sp. NBC_00019]|uniref:polyprenyl synthetase family protein n=1 Tax=Streptomyces sp. NBC_00019 TaxID=2975623 RepID=UPI00324677F8
MLESQAVESTPLPAPEGVRDGFLLPRGDFEAVEQVLRAFLLEQEASSDAPEVAELVGWVGRALSGGKRLRPLLCCLGWRAGGGTGRLPEAVARVAASLEMFHTFAVLHDDVMDAAPERRGQPTAQRVVAARHADHPQADLLGMHTAILLGDIALGWSYELVCGADIGALRKARIEQALATMRTETVVGQYLDLTDSGYDRLDVAADVDRALRIARGKTAGYSVAWPLHVGAVLAGADETVVATLDKFGVAIGEAFQLRDDLLNVFGHTATTGKPTGDDLCHGKHTVLLAVAWRRADSHQRAALSRLMTRTCLDAAGLEEARTILTATGARFAVEELIAARFAQAQQALAETLLPADAAATLTDLARMAVDRDR